MNKALLPSDPKVNATVMASAGTGKTWLLVTRLVRLLIAGASPDGILAITFTRKAAAEMQTRLIQRLRDLATEDTATVDAQLRAMGLAPTDQIRSRANALYEQVLWSPRPVRTTTFHAFCQEILRRFPLEADVPPGFDLLEQTGDLEDAAWDALLAGATAMPDGELATDLEQLMDLCQGLFGMQQALNAFVQHRSDWWAYTQGADAPVDYAIRKLAEQLKIDTASEPYGPFFSECHEELAEFARLLARHAIQTNVRHADAIATSLASRPDEQAFLLIKQAFFTSTGDRRARKASATLEKRLGSEGVQRLLQLHERLCSAIERTQDAANSYRTFAINRAWYRAGAALLGHFQRLKQEQRVLDFADLEWQAYRLLSGPENAHWVQYKLDQRIDHLLVDEFQDTNPTQWRLILPLLEEMAAGADADRLRSVFLVGDAKQSIYRFRRAEPRLFTTAHRWLQSNLMAVSHNQHRSRRSAPAIVSAVNRIFSGRLGQLLPDFIPHETYNEGVYGRVEVLPLSVVTVSAAPDDVERRQELRDPLTSPRTLVVDERHLLEGRVLASRIRQIIAEGLPIEVNGQVRPACYADVLILVRSRTHVADYEAALREAGIPFTGADRGTLLQSREVQDLVALLTILITPYDNLALATVLRSPLFSCDESDLEMLARTGGGSWFGRLEQTSEQSPTLHRASMLLQDWHRLAGRLPIHDLLDRIYHEGDVPTRYEAAFPPHLRSRARANLTRFIELALEIDSGRYPSLTGFLSRLAALRQRDREAPDEAPGGGTGNRVRILTIHAAKGLEAAIVFLADAAANPIPDKGYRSLVAWPPEAPAPAQFLLVGRRAHMDPLSRELVAEQQAADEREAANLLYVALTRARQYLIISGSEPTRGEDTGWWGDIVRALDPEAPDGMDRPFSLEEGERPPATAPDPEPHISPATVPPKLQEPLRQPFGWREIAPSHRVDGLTGTSEPDEDGRLRGTAIHRLLQHLTGGARDRQAIIGQVASELNLPAEDPLLEEWFGEAERLLRMPHLAELFDSSCFEQAMDEVPLQYRLGRQTVHGIIDRVVVREADVWLIDYKTHRSLSPTPHELASHYREQMALYADGLRRIWPLRPVRTFILFTINGHLEEIPCEQRND